MPTNEDSQRTVEALIAANVRAARLAAGMSQSELAEWASRSGLAMYQQTIDKIERGTRKLTLAEAVVLSEVLQVPLQDLAADPSASARQLRRLAETVADLVRDLSSHASYLEGVRAELWAALNDTELTAGMPDAEREELTGPLRSIPEYFFAVAAEEARHAEAARRGWEPNTLRDISGLPKEVFDGEHQEEA